MKIKTKSKRGILLSNAVMLLSSLGFHGVPHAQTENSNIVIKAVEFHKIKSNSYAQPALGVNVVIDYKGEKPTWWKHATTNITLQNPAFSYANGKVVPVKPFTIGSGRYMASQNLYRVWLTIIRPKSYKLPKGTSFQATVILRERAIPVTSFKRIKVPLPHKLLS